jgi:hypothetical protein
MNGKMIWQFPAALLLCSLVASLADAGTVIYRETFGHSVTNAGTGQDPGPAMFDWAVHSSASGTWRQVAAGVTNQANVNATGGVTLTATPANIVGANSKPYDLLNVNAGEPTTYPFDTNGDSVPDLNPRGVAYISGTAWGATSADRRCLYWTPEYSVDPSAYPQGLKFSWYQGNGNVNDEISLAIRIGLQWYVSNTRFKNSVAIALNNTATGFAQGAELKEFAYTTNASAWSLLTFDGVYDTITDLGVNSAVGLAVGGAPGSNLSGVINAFGLYSHDPATTGAANRRFDTFQIETIPEPTTAMLALLCGCALLARRRSG